MRDEDSEVKSTGNVQYHKIDHGDEETEAEECEGDNCIKKEDEEE